MHDADRRQASDHLFRACDRHLDGYRSEEVCFALGLGVWIALAGGELPAATTILFQPSRGMPP